MRDPQTDKVIELYALYSTPAVIFRRLREEFGDNALSAGTVRKIRESNHREIIQKREELCKDIPILDEKTRWGYLQDIIDGAMEGEVLYDRTGIPIAAKVDRAVALNGIKLANDLATKVGAVNTDDDELMKSIIKEAYEEMRGDNPDLSNEEILNEILLSLGDKVKPYVTEMKQELYNEN